MPSVACVLSLGSCLVATRGRGRCRISRRCFRSRSLTKIRRRRRVQLLVKPAMRQRLLRSRALTSRRKNAPLGTPSGFLFNRATAS